MLFAITDITRFKSTAKQAINLANSKMNSSASSANPIFAGLSCAWVTLNLKNLKIWVL